GDGPGRYSIANVSAELHAAIVSPDVDPRRRLRAPSRPLSAGALAVVAPWPAAGPTLAFLQLLLRPANPAFSGHFPLGILDPADELVAGQRRDVLPGIECRGVGGQRLAQISWKPVHHPTGHSRAAHRATVVKRLNKAEGLPGQCSLLPRRSPRPPPRPASGSTSTQEQLVRGVSSR